MRGTHVKFVHKETDKLVSLGTSREENTPELSTAKYVITATADFSDLEICKSCFKFVPRLIRGG